jgi:hypothetical protein
VNTLSVKTAKDRRALIRKKIEFTYGGWALPESGTVLEIRGKNINIDGDWRWSELMHNVKEVIQEPKE